MLDRVPWSSSRRETAFPGQSEYITYSDVVRLLRRYFLTLAISILLGGSLAAAYIWNAVPIYTAKAQLLIDSKIPSSLREQTDGGFSLDTPQIESQIALLRSEQIAEKIVAKLDLVNDPDFRLGSGSGGLRAKLKFWREPPTEPSDFERLRHAIGALQGGMDVRRVGVSYAIDISFSSHDPQKAALIANEIADAFLEDQLASRAQAARQGSEWLEERIDELRKQMNAANLTVQEFRAKRDYRIVGRRDRAPDNESSSSQSEDGAATGGEHKTLEELESKAHTYRKIYESYLQAYAESVQRQSYPVANARLITKATRPLGKSHPRTTLILALGLAMGAFIGCGVIFVRHTFDWSVHSPRQIRDEIGLDCLGQIPRHDHKSGHRLRGRFVRSRSGPRLFEVIETPFSRFSESLKSVKTAIGLASKERVARRIGITSSLPQEGKSMVAANLAALYALSGARTLIIDADLRHPTISQGLARKCTVGLVETLTGEAPLGDCIVPGKNGGPDLLPIVAGRTILNTGDVLGSENMHQLLQQLPSHYDMVIVDLPPIKPVIDGLAIGALLDGVVMVAEWGNTPLPLLAESVHALRTAQANVVGVVLTKVDNPATVHYGSGAYAREHAL